MEAPPVFSTRSGTHPRVRTGFYRGS